MFYYLSREIEKILPPQNYTTLASWHTVSSEPHPNLEIRTSSVPANHTNITLLSRTKPDPWNTNKMVSSHFAPYHCQVLPRKAHAGSVGNGKREKDELEARGGGGGDCSGTEIEEAWL